MEENYSALASYFRTNPVTFEEFQVAVKRQAPNGFFVLVGRSRPFIYTVNDDTDEAEETHLGTVIIYDPQEQTLDKFYQAQTIYNNELDSLTTSLGVNSTAEVDLESALDTVRLEVSNKEWIPDERILSAILKERGFVVPKFQREFLRQMNYPNAVAVEIMKKQVN